MCDKIFQRDSDRLQDTASVSYNGFGQVTGITDPRGDVITVGYGADRYLSQVTRDGKTVLARTHDPAGRVATQTDSTGVTLSFGYDDLDNVTSVSYPDGNSLDYTYSTCCPRLLESVTDRGGRQTRYFYDALQRPTAVRDAEGSVTRLKYDRNGNPVAAPGFSA